MLLDNLFQVMGLLASASERQRQHRASQIRAFLEVGKPLSFEGEILFEGCRRNSGTAERALRDLQDARIRLSRGIFWFTDGGVVDDQLLAMISSQDWISALTLSKKVLDKGSFGGNSLSTVSNHATLAMFLAISMKDDSMHQVFSIGKWKGRKEAFLFGLETKARVISEGEESALVEQYGRVADSVLVRTRRDILNSFLVGVEEVVSEVNRHGMGLTWGEVISVLGRGGVDSEALEVRLVASIRKEVDAIILDVNDLNAEMGSSQAMDRLLALQQAALHVLQRIREVSGEDEAAFSGESSRLANSLFEKSCHYWNSYSQNGKIGQPMMNRPRLESFRQFLSVMMEMSVPPGLAMNIENAFNVVAEALHALELLEGLNATRNKNGAARKKSGKEEEPSVATDGKEELRRRRNEEARRQLRKEAGEFKKDRQKQVREKVEARRQESRRQGRKEKLRMSLDRSAPHPPPDWFIEWLVEFDLNKSPAFGPRFSLVRQSLNVGKTSYLEILWKWARKEKRQSVEFDTERMMKWCGQEFAHRVVPFLEQCWQSPKASRFPDLESVTEKTWRLFGRRTMDRYSNPQIALPESLMDRLDELMTLADDHETVQLQQTSPWQFGKFEWNVENPWVWLLVAAAFFLWLVMMGYTL